MKLLARNLERARAILEMLDFSPAGVRGDLDRSRTFLAFLHSARDLIDLAAQSAALVHGNERPWRVFRQRVEELVGDDEQRAPRARGLGLDLYN